MKKKINILEEANKITSGDRRKDYGDVKENVEQVAKVCSELLKKDLSAKDISLIMIVLKLCREAYCSKRDNAVDIAGYAWVLSEVVNDEY